MESPSVLHYDGYKMLMESATVSGHQLALDIDSPHDPTCIFWEDGITLCETHRTELTNLLNS